MIHKLDHVVILVHNLDVAIRDYTALGFSVVPGGTHADGATHNALVSFRDGSYFELIAFLREAPEHRWWKHQAIGEGLIDFALLPTQIEEDMQAARARGLALDGPTDGGRNRPDGTRIAWKTGRAPTADLPFLCADVTARDLRVPSGEAWQHSNGVLGIAELSIAVDSTEDSVRHYQALLGREPEADGRTFMLGETRLHLIAAQEDALGHLQTRLDARGQGPFGLTLRSRADAPNGALDPQRTHQVPMVIV